MSDVPSCSLQAMLWQVSRNSLGKDHFHLHNVWPSSFWGPGRTQEVRHTESVSGGPADGPHRRTIRSIVHCVAVINTVEAADKNRSSRPRCCSTTRKRLAQSDRMKVKGQSVIE